ncbi:MAG TPA: hypothetical protein VFR55_05855, partial [Dehalococcoidia bacterium]|nr:hypothetical protein [Dehalococcoidia bacterium]
HLADASVDLAVMDPPYYDNVMYAELSDFFYVWLKRTAGYVYPEWFRRSLTDKEQEAWPTPPGSKARVVPEPWPTVTTSSAWRLSSPRADGCSRPTAC